MSDLEDFTKTYETHVGYVAAGDVASAVGDMVAANVPAVFEGVDVPRGDVDGYEIRDTRADGARMIGEAVYSTEGRRIGLRSIWERHEGRWLAAELENFEADR